MTHRTYTLEPQRLIAGQGYVPCQPHRACRVVIIEVTRVPAKNGRRPYFIRRNYQTCSGAGMLARAQQILDRLVRGSKSRREEPRGIWGRSCTIAEYDEIMDRRREEGSY